MTIKTLCKYLENNNYKYELTLYGDEGSFENAPGYVYEAATITIESRTSNDLRRSIDQIEKYAKRYNLDIFHRGHISFNHLTDKFYCILVIRTYENKNGIDKYYSFWDMSHNACDNLIHEYHENGLYKSHNAELNAKLKDIMNYYGNLYNESLKQVVNA